MKPKALLVVIITCWCLLLTAVVLKLCGANWFIASSKNETFIKICDYIDNHIVLQDIIFYILNTIFSSLYYMAVFKEKKPTLNSLKWFIPLIIYNVFKVIFYKQRVLFLILDVVMTVGVPLIIDYKKWFVIIISAVLVIVFELISGFLKLDNYKMFDENTLVGIILSIDYYIMILLYFLHRIYYKGKEVNYNG